MCSVFLIAAGRLLKLSKTFYIVCNSGILSSEGFKLMEISPCLLAFQTSPIIHSLWDLLLKLEEISRLKECPGW